MNLFVQYVSTYIFHFSLVLFFFIVFVVIGGLGRSLFFRKNKLSIRLVDIFPNLFVGLVLVVTIFSLYSTKLQSINFLFVFVGLGFFYKRQDFLKLDVDFEEHTNHKYILFAFFIISFSLLFNSIYQYNYESFAGYRRDDLFYTTVAYHLSKQGLENGFHVANLVNDDVSLSYYHYFELWLTSFFYRFSKENINTVFVLYSSTLINFSALLALYYFLVTEFKLSSTKLFILLTVFGFLSATTFPFYRSIFGKSLDYGFQNIFLGNHDTTSIKSTLLFLPICMGLLFLRKQHLFFTGIMISILVIFSAVMLPFAFISTFFLVLYSFFNEKRELKELFLYSFIFYSLFIIFYYLHGKIDEKSATLYFSIYQEIYFRVRITLSLTTKTFIYFLPYFIVIVIFFRNNIFKKEKKILLLYLILVVTTAFMATFLYKRINYLQIADIINFNLTKILIVFFIAKISIELNKTKSSIIISLLFFLLYSTYKPIYPPPITLEASKEKREFEKQVRLFFGKDNIKDTPIFGVYIYPITNANAYSVISIYNSPFVSLSTIQSGLSLLSLSHIDIPNNEKDPIDSLNFEIALKNDPFYKFIQKQKKQGEFESLNQSRYDFIIKYRPYFLAVKKEEEIPDLLRPMLGERIENKPAKVILYKLNYTN